MQIKQITAHQCWYLASADCKDQVSQHVHVLDSLIHELQSLNIEWKQTVDDSTDRIDELEKALASLQLTVDNNDIKTKWKETIATKIQQKKI